MSARRRAREPISNRALMLLRDIVVLSRAEGRPVSAAEVIPDDSPTRVALYNSLHVLANRWLIVIVEHRIRPRQAGVVLLRRRGVL